MSEPPALPFGWSQHLAPTGQVYYYNVNTQESTYTRPLAPPPAAAKRQKERPHLKTQIAGTDWIRVTTTDGNVFFSNKVTKQSVWTTPEEIAAQVEALDREVAEAVSSKRKAEDTIPTKTKKLKTHEDASDAESQGEEDWEKEAKAQLAAAAEDQKLKVEEERKRLAEVEAERDRLRAAIPQRVDLSVEEAKALFKVRVALSLPPLHLTRVETLLREKDINPVYPWDLALPKFVNDPRYVLLSSVSARREAFDEYCRERSREIRQETVKKETLDPKEEFERLLQAEAKSTRTSWSDFRRTWKKDPRFYGWGRDDREREKKFKEWIRDLGESKGYPKPNSTFSRCFESTKSSKMAGLGKMHVKKKLVDDPRYDAVGSSSLREELFNTLLKGTTPNSRPDTHATTKAEVEELPVDQEQRRKERAQQAVQQRENQVRAELSRVEAEIGRTREVGQKEEGEALFMTMLVDAIRDPQMTWELVVPLLSEDPRFQHSRLPQNVQVGLFQAHINHLRSKHMSSLHSLFETHAPRLDIVFDALPLESLLSAQPVTKLGFDTRTLEREFERWQRERTAESRKAFDQMLTENAFIEFWGKLRKVGGEGVDGGVKADDEGKAEDEGEGGGGKVDMKALASRVDVAEIEKVLQNDKRYEMFAHIHDQRTQWIRNYLAELPPPKFSVHI
ncbi:hypothetical protein MKEN_00099900 [Mycena kentingensis (nom. inval.)]|nr:hypothetical protein MKEN_00099900 [Mycena kentingensis (nom. inval.)]